MNVNVYLPDEIGRQAKAADINLSALLRAAVTEELTRLTTLQELTDAETEPVEFTVVEDGNPQAYRIWGQVMNQPDIPFQTKTMDDPWDPEQTFLVTAKGNIVVIDWAPDYGDSATDYHVYSTFDEFVEASGDDVPSEFLAHVAQAVGVSYVIDLDV